MKNALICFTRVPRPGVTKTRLLPVLTPEQCAGLHWAFLRDLAQVYEAVDAHLFVAYTADESWKALKPVFPTARDFFPQEGVDLGEKMYNAIARVLGLGYEAVVLTGKVSPLSVVPSGWRVSRVSVWPSAERVNQSPRRRMEDKGLSG